MAKCDLSVELDDADAIHVGGGTITDICKYAAYRSQDKIPDMGEIPLIICQSATSGSAFGANQAVIEMLVEFARELNSASVVENRFA